MKLAGIVTDDSSTAAKTFLTARTTNAEVTLLLKSPETRNSLGRLEAYAYIDGSCLNGELVKAGMAFADRRQADVMSGMINPAEAEARKKKRGLWATLTFEQMPEWRRAWLRGFKQQPAVSR